MSTEIFLLVLLGAAFNAAWNLAVRGYREKPGFVWGVGVWSGIWPLVFIPFVYTHLAWNLTTLLCGLTSGFCLSIYYFFLEKAYRCGEVSVIYPIIRSSPLWVAMAGVMFMGVEMSWLAWTGMLMTLAGVSILPLVQLRKQRQIIPDFVKPAGHQWAPLLALGASLGTSLYSLSDKVAMDMSALAPMAGVALTSISSTSKLLFWSVLTPTARRGFEWKRLSPAGVPTWATALCGFAVFAAYTIIICAFQYSDAGRVMAIYNVSIVLVAVGGVVFFKERSGIWVRILGLGMTLAGVTLLRLF